LINIGSPDEAADWAHHLREYWQSREPIPHFCEPVDVEVRPANPAAGRPDSENAIITIDAAAGLGTKTAAGIEFARCLLRLANLPNFALDRLSRYEATLWRQVGRILLHSTGLIGANHKKGSGVFVPLIIQILAIQ
jgi:hypothetical protein